MIDALPLLLGPEGYQISRSVRLRSSASGYLTRTISAASTSTTICTWSGWAKRGALGIARATIAYHGNAGGSGGMIDLEFASDTLRCFHDGTNFIQTSAVYRDPSAWYHVVLVYDSTQATASNRLKLFVNGLQVTAFSTASYPALNQAINAGSTNVQNLGLVGAHQFDGYLTEINFIDGQALTPASFGETNAVTGVWQPKKYTGTYGTNGFYLNFSDNSNNTAATIGKDYSGNGNNWTPNNISVSAGVTYDSMLDVPTPWADGGNGRGNYCTLNPLDTLSGTITEGNLAFTSPATGYGGTRCTIATPTTGKWYWEVTVNAIAGGFDIGISSANEVRPVVPGESSTSYGYRNDGAKRTNGADTVYGAAYTTNDVIGVALDMDAGTLVFYKNNTSQGTAFSGLSGNFLPMISDFNNSAVSSAYINFGQRPFAYTPPSGFKALNTLNLPAPTILKGNQYFDVSLWTGNGTSQSITNSGSMQPDLVWGKKRNAAASHALVDSVRGVNKTLFSNLTDVEDTALLSVTAFNSNGFSIGTAGNFNANGDTYVGWQWKEGATQGFDIVTYTGNGTNRTIAHSLGVAPSMMIVKRRTTAGGDWDVYHSATGATKRLFLNTTAASQTTSVAWNDTAPTSSVFTVGTGANVNQNGDTYVAYLWSEVAGFSKFGSYTGNGSSDGPFVFCGFRPRFVMIKGSSFTSNWFIQDGARNGYNVNTGVALRPNLSNAEDGTTFYDMDLLSNGFKLRTSTGDSNSSGATFIFAAFAENPFKNSLAR